MQKQIDHYLHTHGKYICYKCHMVFKDKTLFHGHLTVMHDFPASSFFCRGNCRKDYVTAVNLNRHLAGPLHVEKSVYQCQITDCD